ncbi:unnamed protein product (macronuclear) [Paramecium tetraurelia]|uniref:CRAL-TRIO domain-containing protein n=1 Tax=Paramecium tetraurelia TaxID=5888 RepID=A0E4R2_PARTE|nr:uncharacterized protein GSPATT00023454001 [Paramecium tetraurelia]CAK90279.1 unnamed protein product [Paramecium tetraurelia]|eukprot:XP_001457676.1 hypothetical protein (macronuclear) [Paramecium tetraurelia strain d4-2]
MGNLEHGCLSRSQQITNINNKERPSQLKRQYVSEKIRNSFLYPIPLKEIQIYSKKLGISNYDPHSKTLTKQIIEVSNLNQNLELSLCRFLLVSQSFNLNKISEILKQNQEFRQSIRPIENELLKEAIRIIGVDFQNGLVLSIKLDKINVEIIQQYLLFFFEYLFYEIAKINKLSNHIIVVYDLQQEAVNQILLNFLVNLTYKHYFLNIRKVILINLNIEKVSQEAIGMLTSSQYSYLFIPLANTAYLARHVRKSELSNEYGGVYQKQRNPIPITVSDATKYKL